MANNVLLTLSLQSPRRDGRRADSVVAGFVFTPRGGDFTRLKMGGSIEGGVYLCGGISFFVGKKH